MNSTSFILTISVILFCVSCKSGQRLFTHQRGNTAWKDIDLLAWNEDTVNSYQFALARNKFFYTIFRRDGAGKSEQYYSGTYLNSLDTLYLHYRNGKQPENLAP